MAILKTLGGDRLGSGKKMKVELHNYERSTHDLGYIWRSTMATGTLVPFMVEIGLPGDTFDINLNADVKTHPTLGPLFGSFKMQLDVFTCPIRLYQGKLHNNKLGIGMNMAAIKLPLINIECNNIEFNSEIQPEFQQINQSCILAYLGIRGLGRGDEGYASRYYNAIPYLAYWDIYKNYYANKQEEIGAVIHASQQDEDIEFERLLVFGATANDIIADITTTGTITPAIKFGEVGSISLRGKGVTVNNIQLRDSGDDKFYSIGELFETVWQGLNGYINARNPKPGTSRLEFDNLRVYAINELEAKVNIETFPLEVLDNMREDILSMVKNSEPYTISRNSMLPYRLPLTYVYDDQDPDFNHMIYARYAQEGLAIKTYQSDIFNNWLSTEWIDGENGISAISAVDTSSGSFTMDTLNLAKKVYEMLNRIAVSGGSYDDWLEAVWAHDGFRKAETPIYMGGMAAEIEFQEVVSNTAAETDSGLEPLGTLAGRGSIFDRKKGGNIYIKIEEPSYVMGIVSITPRIDYSQGNRWDTELKTMDNLHKPALDQIGFQELITTQIAFWDTGNDGGYTYSAGKQPAWINYMTNYNRTYGEFAKENSEMFMTLNRRYEMDENYRIKDLTTYIDPEKFNYAFALTSRSAQNFWVQIANSMTVRRKMSAKVMPNL